MIITGTEYIRANLTAQDIADSANVAYWLESRDINIHHHTSAVDRKFRELAGILGYVVAPAASKRHCAYEEMLCIGSTAMQIGLDYTYEPGDAESGPDVQFSKIYWRDMGDDTPWQQACPAMRELLIEAMGGEVSLVEDICAHAEGRAEAEAHDRAELARDLWSEAAE